MQPVSDELDEPSIVSADMSSVASDRVPRPLSPDGTVVDDEDELASILVFERALGFGMLVVVAFESVSSASKVGGSDGGVKVDLRRGGEGRVRP
jgi:hypothetical protein